MDIHQLIIEAARKEASDIHLVVGFPPMLRVSGVLFPVEGTNILTVKSPSLIYSTFAGDRRYI